MRAISRSMWLPAGWRKIDKANRGVITQHIASLAWIIDKAKRAPCTDCLNTYTPVAMDFDHLPQHRKSFTISQYRELVPSVAVLEAEIAKCDVVCANCHRQRTQERNRERAERRAREKLR